MFRIDKIQDIISIILLIGVFISTILVLIGGTLYLIEYGSNSLQSEIIQTETIPMTIKQIWSFAFSFTPLGLIELGLLTLVSTQIFRIAFLTGFYAMIRDYWFTAFSLFVLLVLIYCSFLRN